MNQVHVGPMFNIGIDWLKIQMYYCIWQWLTI